MTMGNTTRTTASRPTGASPTGGPGGHQKANFVFEIMNKIKEMPLKVKIIYLAVILFIFGGAFGINFMLHKDDLAEPLFPVKLTASDVNDISRELTKMNVKHVISPTNDQVFVKKDDKNRLASLMTEKGYPKRAVTALNNDKGGLNMQTKDDKYYERLNEMKISLENSIRTNPKIADAVVNLVAPPDNDITLEGEEKDVRATVSLTIVEGEKLDQNQIKGIQKLVSMSVIGLKEENVAIVDQNQNILNTSGGIGSTEIPNDQLTLQEKKSKMLMDKAQAALDRVFGSGKTKVTVDVELDFSKKEIVTHQVGNPGEGKVLTNEILKSETYNDGSSNNSGDVTNVSLPGQIEQKNNNNYKNEQFNKQYDANKQDTVTQKTDPEVKRISANVVVDNLKEEQLMGAVDIVKGAINYNDERGDQITYASIPFTTNNNVMSGNGLLPGVGNNPQPGFVPHPSKQTNANQWMIYMFFPTLILILIAGVFFMRQRKVQLEQTQKMLSRIPATTTNNIADLLMDKTGKTTETSLANPTRVNRNRQQLESLAKNKPTKIAEMLKTTWMADK